MKYRKRPVIIEATRWVGHNPESDPDVRTDSSELNWNGQNSSYYTCNQCGKLMQQHGKINTLEGPHIVCPGDYVVTGIKGEKYAVKPDMFELTYERVE
jgi:hypothetical protein